MNNKQIILKKIGEMEKSKKELLLQMKLERGRNKYRKLEKQLQFKDGIIRGLWWARENVK